jgi:hypothetical protein
MGVSRLHGHFSFVLGAHLNACSHARQAFDKKISDAEKQGSKGLVGTRDFVHQLAAASSAMLP